MTLTILDPLNNKLGNLKAIRSMNHNSKCLRVSLCGERVECLQAKIFQSVNNCRTCTTAPLWILLPDNTQPLLSVQFRFMGWSGSFRTLGQHDIHSQKNLHMFQLHLWQRQCTFYNHIKVFIFLFSVVFLAVTGALSVQLRACRDSSWCGTIIHHNKQVVCFCWQGFFYCWVQLIWF